MAKPNLTEKQMELLRNHSTPQHRLMEIDIAPCDKNQEWSKLPTQRINIMWQKYLELYNMIFEHCNYFALAQEVSPTGRIHYHSNIMIKEGEEYYVRLHVGKIIQNYGDQVHFEVIEDGYIDYRRLYLQKDRTINGHRYMENNRV
jgi:hypothetical protein